MSSYLRLPNYVKTGSLTKVAVGCVLVTTSFAVVTGSTAFPENTANKASTESNVVTSSLGYSATFTDNEVPPASSAKVLASQALPLVDIPQITAVSSEDESVTNAQKTYVQAMSTVETNSRDAIRLAHEAGQKTDEAAAALVQWNEKTAIAQAAQTDADTKKQEAGKLASQVYRSGSAAMDPNVAMAMSLLNGNADSDYVQGIGQVGVIAANKNYIMEQAADAAAAAQKASDEAAAQKQAADNVAADAKKLSDDSEAARKVAFDTSAQAQVIADDLSKQINQAEVDQGKLSSLSASQRVLNVAAISQWNDYLTSLNTASTYLPTKSELSDPQTSLPEGFTPVYGADGNALRGVAEVEGHKGLVVLPFETLQAVSQALSRVGSQYSADSHDGTYSCSAIVAGSYDNPADTSLAALWGQGNYTPMVDRLPGDIVFSSVADAGLTQAGVYLGGGLVVAADASTGYVQVEKVDDSTAFGVVRPSVAPSGNTPAAPVANENAPKITCGGVEGQASMGASSWVIPVDPENFNVSMAYEQEDAARFGKKSPKSPGTEFSGAANSSVYAMSAGNVTVTENNPLSGNTVTIAQSSGTKITYSNLDKVFVQNGSNIPGGTVIGTMGQTGSQANKKSPAVMVSMTLVGIPTDPMKVLIASPSAYTGSSDGKYSSTVLANGSKVLVNSDGYLNGQLPESVLCPVGVGSHRLRCDAAAGFQTLAAAYKAKFGTDIVLTDTYRTYAAQIAVKAAKPTLAATPGTSNHGWGLAIDFGGGIQNFGSVQHEWMQQNAPLYGWYHPAWAEPNGSKPEAWHWEYSASDK